MHLHMKCQRQIATIRWQDHIRNTEATALTGLSPVSESIIRPRNSLFGHVTRLAADTPVHQDLRCHVDMTLGRFPDSSWRRRPGRPRNRWLDQLRGDNNSSPADLWRRASSFGGDATVLADYALTTTTTTCKATFNSRSVDTDRPTTVYRP